MRTVEPIAVTQKRNTEKFFVLRAAGCLGLMPLELWVLSEFCVLTQLSAGAEQLETKGGQPKDILLNAFEIGWMFKTCEYSAFVEVA